MTRSISAAPKQKYVFMAFSNPVAGEEATYLDWYTGQHINDLLKIEGFVAAQFFQLTPLQQNERERTQYLMIWEWETDDLQAMFDRVRKGIQSGTTVLCAAFDGKSYFNMTMTPVTRRVTTEETAGKTNAEIQALAAV